MNSTKHKQLIQLLIDSIIDCTIYSVHIAPRIMHNKLDGKVDVTFRTHTQEQAVYNVTYTLPNDRVNLTIDQEDRLLKNYKSVVNFELFISLLEHMSNRVLFVIGRHINWMNIIFYGLLDYNDDIMLEVKDELPWDYIFSKSHLIAKLPEAMRIEHQLKGLI